MNVIPIFIFSWGHVIWLKTSEHLLNGTYHLLNHHTLWTLKLSWKILCGCCLSASQCVPVCFFFRVDSDVVVTFVIFSIVDFFFFFVQTDWSPSRSFWPSNLFYVPRMPCSLSPFSCLTKLAQGTSPLVSRAVGGGIIISCYLYKVTTE